MQPASRPPLCFRTRTSTLPTQTSAPSHLTKERPNSPLRLDRQTRQQRIRIQARFTNQMPRGRNSRLRSITLQRLCFQCLGDVCKALGGLRHDG